MHPSKSLTPNTTGHLEEDACRSVPFQDQKRGPKNPTFFPAELGLLRFFYFSPVCLGRGHKSTLVTLIHNIRTVTLHEVLLPVVILLVDEPCPFTFPSCRFDSRGVPVFG